jgi:hypothetical protein
MLMYQANRQIDRQVKKKTLHSKESISEVNKSRRETILAEEELYVAWSFLITPVTMRTQP